MDENEFPWLNIGLMQLLFNMVNLIHKIHLGIRVLLDSYSIMPNAHAEIIIG